MSVEPTKKRKTRVHSLQMTPNHQTSQSSPVSPRASPPASPAHGARLGRAGSSPTIAAHSTATVVSSSSSGNALRNSASRKSHHLRIDDESESESDEDIGTTTSPSNTNNNNNTTNNSHTSARRHHRTSRDLDDNNSTPILSAIGTVSSLNENISGTGGHSHRSMGRSPRRSNSRNKVLFGSGGLEPLRALTGLRRSHESLRHSASSPRGPITPDTSGLGVSSTVGSGTAAAAASGAGGAGGGGGGGGPRASRQKLARRIEQLKRELRENTKEIRRLSHKAALWDAHKATCAAAATVDSEPLSEDLPPSDNSAAGGADDDASNGGMSPRSPRSLAAIYSSPQRVNNVAPRRKPSRAASVQRGASPFGRYAEYRPQSSGNLPSMMQVEQRESTIKNSLRRRRYSGVHHGPLVASPPPAFSLSTSPLSPPGTGRIVVPIGAGVSLKSQSPVTSPRTSLSLTRAPQRQR